MTLNSVSGNSGEDQLAALIGANVITDVGVHLMCPSVVPRQTFRTQGSVQHQTPVARLVLAQGLKATEQISILTRWLRLVPNAFAPDPGSIAGATFPDGTVLP